MSTRKLVLSSGAVRFLKDAEKRLKVLEALRVKKNANLLKKTYRVENVTVLLQCGRKSKKIIMWSDVEQILFINATHVWGYNYISDAFSKHLALDPQGADLAQAYSPGGFVLGAVVLDYDDGVITSTTRSFLGPHVFLPSRGVSVERFVNDLALRSSTGASPLAVLPVVSDLDWGNLHSVGGTALLEGWRSNMWNQNNGPEAWEIFPDNPIASVQDWRWTPRLWYPDPGNRFYQSGVYYGRAFADVYGPADEIKVTFGGFLDDRKSRDSISRKGYCEVLTQVDSTDYLTAYFFLDLHEADRTSLYYVNLLVGKKYVQNSIWDSQPQEDFAIRYETLFPGISGSLTIHFWTGLDSSDSESAYPLLGVVAHDSLGRYAVHRWHGFAIELFTGSDYKGHTVSSDGAIFALFTGTSEIETLTVYDISAQETLRISSKAAGKGITSGAMIPILLEDTVAPTAPETPPGIANTSQPEMSAALGGAWVPWPTPTDYTIDGWKTLVNGIHATGKQWRDECWQTAGLSFVQPADFSALDRPHAVIVNDTFYSAPSWGGLADQIPYFLYSVNEEGVHNEIGLAQWQQDGLPIPVNISAATNTTVGTIQRNAISFSMDETLKLEVSANTREPVRWPLGAVEHEDGFWYVDETKIDCNGKVLVHLIDSCGESTQQEMDVGIPPLSLGGDEDCNVGDIYTAAGGTGAYAYSFDSGTIDSETGEILSITACPGAGASRVGVVSVSDGCEVIQLEVRLPGGVWALTQENHTGCGGSVYLLAGGNCRCGTLATGVPGELISGGSKTVENVTWYTNTSGCDSLGPPQTLVSAAWGALNVGDPFPLSFECGVTAPNCSLTQYALVMDRYEYEWQCP